QKARTDQMHGPPGAVRSLCPRSAPSSVDQRLSNLEEKLAQALDFSSVDAPSVRTQKWDFNSLAAFAG
ncbi:MAG TPA: hypothetical protein VGY13_12325, partial [Solirubrobacteraceae bacterium]|nr:hypothetical protein [Solirubrobacteraceae bacterium]